MLGTSKFLGKVNSVIRSYDRLCWQLSVLCIVETLAFMMFRHSAESVSLTHQLDVALEVTQSIFYS